MANRTDPLAKQVHGLNPQGLMSRIIRRKVYGCNFWKEHCFAVSAESVIEPCVGLSYVGGTYGGKRQPAPFLCIVLKLLQLQPEEEVILEFIKQERFKYLRAVGAFYFRLVGRAREVYVHLEPLLADYRKLRLRLADGKFKIVCMDEFIDDILKKTAMLDVDLPVLPKRETLEEEGLLPPSRLSALEHDVEVYAGNNAAAAGGAGEGGKRVVIFASEREQQLWLLQKQQLQQQQKTLQRHVQQQRMRLLQQQQEQQLLEQVRELELENDYNGTTTQAMADNNKSKNEFATGVAGGKMQRPKNEEEGEGWWREGTRPHLRHRQQQSAYAVGGGGGGDPPGTGSGTSGGYTTSRQYYHGGNRILDDGRPTTKFGSRSPTPAMMHRGVADAEGAGAFNNYRSGPRGPRHHAAQGGAGGDNKIYKQHGEFQRNGVVEAKEEFDEERFSGSAAGSGRGGTTAESQRYRSGRGSRKNPAGDRRKPEEEIPEPRGEDRGDRETAEEHAGNREYHERGSRRGAPKEADQERGQRQPQHDRKRNRSRRDGDEGYVATDEDEAGSSSSYGDIKRKRRRSHSNSDYEKGDRNRRTAAAALKKEEKEAVDRKEDKSHYYRSNKTRQRRSSTSHQRDDVLGVREEEPRTAVGHRETLQHEKDRRENQKERQQGQEQQKEEEDLQRRAGGEGEDDEDTERARDKRSGRRRHERFERGEEEARRGQEQHDDEMKKRMGSGKEEKGLLDVEKRRKRPGRHSEDADDRRERSVERESGATEGRRHHRRIEDCAAEVPAERSRTVHGHSTIKYDTDEEKKVKVQSADYKEKILRESTKAAQRRGDGPDRPTDEDDKEKRRRRRGEGDSAEDEEREGRRRAGDETFWRRDSVSSAEYAEAKTKRRGRSPSEERESRRQQQDRRGYKEDTEKHRSSWKNDDREATATDKDARRSDRKRRRSASPSPTAHASRDTEHTTRETTAGPGSDDKRAADQQQSGKKLFEHPLSGDSKKRGPGAGKGKDVERSVEEWNALRAELGLKPLR